MSQEMSEDLDAFADLHHENETLRSKLEQKQVEIHGLWRTISRAHDLWQRAELEIWRQKLQIRRLEIALEQMDPGATPPCSPPTI
jgi:hypothetical protein